MILPTKYVPVADSIIGLAAVLLRIHTPNQTVSSLWRAFRQNRCDATFDMFTEALTLLFLLGAVNLESGVLKWGRPNEVN